MPVFSKPKTKRQEKRQLPFHISMVKKMVRFDFHSDSSLLFFGRENEFSSVNSFFKVARVGSKLPRHLPTFLVSFHCSPRCLARFTTFPLLSGSQVQTWTIPTCELWSISRTLPSHVHPFFATCFICHYSNLLFSYPHCPVEWLEISDKVRLCKNTSRFFLSFLQQKI